MNDIYYPSFFFYGRYYPSFFNGKNIIIIIKIIIYEEKKGEKVSVSTQPKSQHLYKTKEHKS
jgi:hypothetical protein